MLKDDIDNVDTNADRIRNEAREQERRLRQMERVTNDLKYKSQNEEKELDVAILELNQEISNCYGTFGINFADKEEEQEDADPETSFPFHKLCYKVGTFQGLFQCPCTCRDQASFVWHWGRGF